MVLVQDKLNVKVKTRANIFNWRGQFTPEFVDYILDSFGNNDSVIVDPFVGSGTVLLEGARKNLCAYGFEINPAAYAMSKFFTFCNLSHQKRKDILISFEKKLFNLVPHIRGKNIFSGEANDYRIRYSNFLEFAQTLFSEVKGSQELILALNLLFLIENTKRNDLNFAVSRSFNYIKANFLNLPFTQKNISVFLRDARLIHDVFANKVDIIFTSPPYINVFNYHQNHRAILELVKWDLLKVAQSEFGANRKHRANRFKTVIQYCLDMEQSLISFYRSLNDDGVIILVIGRESNVRRVPFYNGNMVKDIARELGIFKTTRNFERSFTNKFGMIIKEDIIILKKGEKSLFASKAKEVAYRHLKSSYSLASSDVRFDIKEAIKEIDRVEPSPIFSTKGDFLK